jgi:hypothetical protein
VNVTCSAAPEPPGKAKGEPPHPPACCETIKDVNLYPNPNSGQFTITGLEQGMIVEVYDYTGRRISIITASDLTVQVNISDQPNGIYLIRIVNKTGALIDQKKVIKTK